MEESPSSEIAYVQSFAKSIQPKRILEVGCNFGREMKALEGLGSLYGVDRNKEAIARAKIHLPKARFKVAEASELPYRNNYFDLVYSAGCLSHNEQIDAIVDEMVRVSNRFVALVEYLGTKQSVNAFSNCKANTWIHDYESVLATRNVLVCFNRESCYGVDLFKILLARKNKRKVTEIIKMERKIKPLIKLQFWKFVLEIGKR